MAEVPATGRAGDFASWNGVARVRADTQTWPTVPADETPTVPLQGTAGDEVVPATRRRRYAGIAAVDFGTASCTVTLHDPRERRYPPLSGLQKGVLAVRTVELIGGGWTTGATRVEWDAIVAEVSQRLLPADRQKDTDEPALAGLLRALPPDLPHLLDDVVLELERARSGCSPALRRALAVRLDACYDDTVTQPALDNLRLFPVVLDHATGEDELPSVMWVTRPGEPASVELGHETTAGEDVTPQRGLKQKVGRDVRIDVDGHEMSADALVRGALRFLLQRTDDHIARDGSETLMSGEVVNVVATYPTMAPPQVRQTMRRMLHDLGVPKVSILFDEAIAAAMFFLVREFGGLYDPSVSAFKARSHRVDDDGPPTWRQHMLIVDIGGGTTDIALLELRLVDRTPSNVDDAQRPHYGRAYKLVPQVLGSTGDTLRGGDYLTLLVFHWLKAVLADHLLTTRHADYAGVVENFPENLLDADGTRYRDGALVMEALVDDPGRQATARAAADRIVPTRWDRAGAHETAERRQTFHQLWAMAETAKIDLGRRRPAGAEPAVHVPKENLLRQLLTRVAPKAVPERAAGDWAAGAATLRQDVFDRLVTPSLTEVLRLAADLVRSHLPAEARLDRVALTGRSSRLGLVRDLLVRTLAGDDVRGGKRLRAVPWDPNGLWVEERYAKHATSIGAVWAENICQTVHQDIVDVSRLESGSTMLSIDVRNLFHHLHGSFRTGGTVEDRAAATPLFTSGTPLTRYAPDGPPALRNPEWLPFVENFSVSRERGDGSTMMWAQFLLATYLKDNADPGPDPASAFWRDRVRARVETDAELNMALLLCHATDTDTDTADSTDNADGTGTTAAGTGREIAWYRVGSSTPEDHDAMFLAGEPGTRPSGQVVVNPGVPGSMERAPAHVVFDLDGSGGVYTARFVADDADDAARLGAVSGRPLPVDLPSDGRWSFYLRRTGPDGEPVDRFIGAVDGPDDEPSGVPLPHWVTLDDAGELRVYAGRPPYRSAVTARQLADRPGAVLRVAMTPDNGDRRDHYDPFCGKH
ncbi:virulence factor SrfB [Virgisporangium ochraceum]|uniref:Uncharacterized protein n=1 Tax=Virgisporangium ochraceum TaxID=65505 RepID=A0A8J3ZU49_9ACTN|nr:virulence factor SrfB [Virgisporangium ochraceum]GIJ70519.1 hypothetical protein Voc01_054360 [Virgisporangium ochraceum]